MGTEVHHLHLWRLERYRSAGEFDPVLLALPPSTACATSEADELPHLHNLTCTYPSCVHQIADFQRCFDTVAACELKQSFRFDWIMKLRTDIMWHAPVGPISRFEPMRLHLDVPHGFPYGVVRTYTYSDLNALVPRHLATAYFGIRREPDLCRRGCAWCRTYRCEVLHHHRWPCPLEIEGGCSPVIHCETLLELRFARLQVPVSDSLGFYSIVRGPKLKDYD